MMSITATCDYATIADARARGGVELGWCPSRERSREFASSGWVDGPNLADMLALVTQTPTRIEALVFGLLRANPSTLMYHPGSATDTTGFGGYYRVDAVAMVLTWLVRLGALRYAGTIPPALASRLAHSGKHARPLLTENELCTLWAARESRGPFFISWPEYHPVPMEPRAIALGDSRVLVCWIGYRGGYFEAIARPGTRGFYDACLSGGIALSRREIKRLIDHARPFRACALRGPPRLRVVA
ncbi:MAG TPA: hypothetical protein VFQ88_07515 [Nevskiaceae bacterium]|nr:hypothetical protein [Nevskiaceae bacterium]